MQTNEVKIIKQALRQEIQRSMLGLRRPGYPKPYYVSYLVRDTDSFVVSSQYGSLYLKNKQNKRNCFADIRVGTYKYDQVMQGGLKDTSENSETNELVELPIGNDVDGLRYGIWRLTEARYREALDAYHKKKSRDINFVDQNSTLSALIKENPWQKNLHKPRQVIDEDYWQNYVQKASTVFKKHPFFRESHIEFSALQQTKIFCSSEGVEACWDQNIFSVIVYFWWQNKKTDLDASLVYHFKDPQELPVLKQIQEDIQERIDLYYEIDRGCDMNSYTGPVLLAPKAAGLLFHEVLGHRLEGSRLLSDDEGKTFADKTGAMITHPQLSVYDDPTLNEYDGQSLIGSYPVDDEGAIPERSELIKDGKLVGFLTTRTPCQRSQKKSNGHARNQNHERPISRMGNLIIESKDGLSWQQLKDRLIQILKEKKLPYGLILLDVEGGETGTESYDFQAFLGEVTVAKRIYVNGKEEYVRGVDFVGTPLTSLSHIIAVGDELVVDNGFCGAESGIVPVSTVAPALLLENMELQSKDPARLVLPSMPLPWFDK